MPPNLSEDQLKSKLSMATDRIRDGHLDEAISTLKEILVHEPEHQICLGMLAAIYLQIGMHDKAIDTFKTLLLHHPNNPLAQFQLGVAQLGQGESAEALQTWSPLLADENDFMAHFHSALALLQLDQGHQAYEMLNIAAKRMPLSHPLYPQLLELRSNLSTRLES